VAHGAESSASAGPYDAAVDEQHDPGPEDATPTRSTPGEQVPAERRLLDRPPSERYARVRSEADEDEGLDSARAGSIVRVLVGAVVAGVVGGATLIVLASPLALSEPLVIVAGLAGIAIGLAARWGAGSIVNRTRAKRIAAVVAALTIVVVEVVVWQLALAQGGVLPLVDYLAETFGLVVPLELVAAVVGAWATA
jgi:hypothetical protein